jgi:hypothetical protein
MKRRSRLKRWLLGSALALLAGGMGQAVQVLDHLVRLAREEPLR